MLRSFTVKNFRCFRDLTISSLERVNLLGGKNNVGKTALLEALFLHLGANNPLVPMNINTLRGIEQASTDPQELWGRLFFGKRTENMIETESREENDLRRTLKVSLAEPLTTTIIPSVTGQPALKNGDAASERATMLSTTGSGPSVLTLAYEDTAGRKSEASAWIIHQGDSLALRYARSPADPLPMAIFLNARNRSPAEHAAGFSNAVEMGREEELLERLKILDPNLRRLLVLIVGGVPMVSGDIGTGPPVPLPLMGEGLVRLLSVLLAIGDAPEGLVLIDEIASSLHYSTLVAIWRAIGEAARQSNTQIFATTHSWECIHAANVALGEDNGTRELRFVRLERSDDDVRAVTFVDDLLGVAIETGLEIR